MERVCDGAVMRAGFFSLSPFRLPHYLNGSIGSLNIGAFSIFFNTFGYFGCDNDRNNSVSCKRQGWKSQQEGRETDGTERRDWLALVLASGLHSGRQNRCVFPRTPVTTLRGSHLLQTLGPFVWFFLNFISGKNASAAGK